MCRARFYAVFKSKQQQWSKRGVCDDYEEIINKLVKLNENIDNSYLSKEL